MSTFPPPNGHELPRVVLTVRLAEWTGAHLMGLIQRAATGELTKFAVIEYYRDDLYFEVGQTSEDPHRQLRVVPNLENPFFDPDGAYRQAVVTTHNWGRNRPDSFDKMMEAVRQFSERLKDAARVARQAGHCPCYPVDHKT